MINLPSDLQFPLLVRPKLRGVRSFILNGEAMLKVEDRAISLPNRFIADILSGLPAFDGFIVIGSPLEPVCTANTYEAVMADIQAPVFTFHVVDLITTGKYAFKERYKMYREYTRACRQNIQAVWHKDVADEAKLSKFYQDTLFGHYTGIVARDPEAKVGGIWSL